MFTKKINYISSLFLIFVLFFSFYPTSVKADVANCSIDSFFVTSGLSVQATWSMYSTTGGTYYDVYMSWDGGPQFLVGKQNGDPSYADSGIVNTTFSSYGTHTVSINVGGVHCSDVATLTIPDPGPQLGTICADANIGTRIVISGPGGTFVGNPSVCADTVVGTYTVTGDPVANYNGPSYSNGQTLTIPAGGAVSTFLTYSPYLYRCSGAGSCIRDDVNGNTTSSNCNNSCVVPVNGTCGTANGKTYASGVTSYGSDTQCSSGSSSNTAFPAAGGSVSWTCSGSGGGSSSGTCTASRSAVAAAPTVSVSASPTSVTSGGSSTITWSSTNATSCSVSPSGWTGTSGSQSTGALTATRTYTVSCTGAGGTSSNSATVTVTSAPIVTPTAPASITATCNASGNQVTLNWGASTNAVNYLLRVDPAPVGTTANCGATGGTLCVDYYNGTSYTASVSPGQAYTSWVHGNSCADYTVSTSCYSTPATSVSFTCSAPSPYSLTVTKVGRGTVSSADNLISCGADCYESYTKNASVTLTATPASSYWKFTGWSGSCSGVGACVLLMSGPKSVQATFERRLFNYIEF